MLHVRKSSQGSYDPQTNWRAIVDDGFDDRDVLQDGRRSCRKVGVGGESEPFKVRGAGCSAADQPQAREILCGTAGLPLSDISSHLFRLA
jgi:hypothetical protein